MTPLGKVYGWKITRKNSIKDQKSKVKIKDEREAPWRPRIWNWVIQKFPTILGLQYRIFWFSCCSTLAFQIKKVRNLILINCFLKCYFVHCTLYRHYDSVCCCYVNIMLKCYVYYEYIIRLYLGYSDNQKTWNMKSTIQWTWGTAI